MLNTLSGRFLILTIVFVMIAEILIFVPSVARFRADYLLSRLERAQIASLALLADDAIDPALEAELLRNAEVFNVVLRRNEVRQLMLSSPIETPIAATYDMRDATAMELIANALTTLVTPGDRVIRVFGDPVRQGGELIEITMATEPMRKAMLEYGLRVLLLSAVISIVTAFLLFVAVRRFLVLPIRRVVDAMASYAAAPEDARRIIEPSAGVAELREAETALQSMQTQLTGALRQKERLAQLGGAVAKISHDLRNVLTTAQLFADRIEGSSTDPTVARLVPKLVGSISRAVNICEGTLAFGRAEEPPPSLTRLNLAAVVNDVIDAERLAAGDLDISFGEDVPAGLSLRADGEQLYRVLHNLVRNARQAIAAKGGEGEIVIRGNETSDDWIITVCDTGPGLPLRARDHLFEPFQSSGRGGTGLGLTIAHELVRGHGGELALVETGPEGTTFRIRLPKAVMHLDAAG